MPLNPEAFDWRTVTSISKMLMSFFRKHIEKKKVITFHQNVGKCRSGMLLYDF